MAKLDCYSAGALNIIIGTLLLILGLLFFATGFTILPVMGFFFAVPIMVASVSFLFAPRDRTCFLP